MSAHKVYGRRWFVLLTITLLNVSNTELWACFSCVSTIAQRYYDASESQISLLSMIYFICCIPTGIFALWFVDYIGLKKGVWLGAWLNVVGAAIKFMSNTQFVEQQSRFKIILFGQAVCASAQMFINVPTKAGELWFPSNERTLATSVIAMGCPLGIMLGIGMVPVFVTSPEDIPWLNFSSCVFAVVGVVATCFTMTSSKPPTPPSESAEAHQTYSFPAALRELFTNKAYIILLLFAGAITGVYAVFVSSLEEILLLKGYSNKFSGLCVVLMISFGFVAGLSTGIFLDRTKLFSITAKVLAGVAFVLLDIFTVIAGYSDMQYAIAVLIVLFGIFIMSAYTVNLELSIECTFPLVPEATSTGILFIVGQIHGTVYLFIMQMGIIDMRSSLFVVNAILTLLYFVFVVFFKTEYKRLKEEESSKNGKSILRVELGNSVTYGTIQ
ncbi:uncharacterized protein B0416.5-like [Centruroides vittatus]|uniref:uncharacterized protein B0416.5-like n=1 Tax=Centruroides vittatus TaxID=120091 RepID=UPI00350FB018